MKMKWLNFLLVGLLFHTVLRADWVNEVMKGAKGESLYNLSMAANEKFPEIQSVKALNILLEKNGLQAAQSVQEFITSAPAAPVSTWMLLVLADYYTVVGNQGDTEKLLQKAVARDANVVEDAYYQYIESRIKGNPKQSSGIKSDDRMSVLAIDAEGLELKLTEAGAGASRLPAIPAPPGGISATGPYHLQVGAYSDMKNALILVEFFRTRGFAAQVQPKEQSGITIYAVWVGNFETRDQAVAARDRIVQNYNKNSFIVKN